jgi:hypothetical protein
MKDVSNSVENGGKAKLAISGGTQRWNVLRTPYSALR